MLESGHTEATLQCCMTMLLRDLLLSLSSKSSPLDSTGSQEHIPRCLSATRLCDVVCDHAAALPSSLVSNQN